MSICKSAVTGAIMKDFLGSLGADKKNVLMADVSDIQRYAVPCALHFGLIQF